MTDVTPADPPGAGEPSPDDPATGWDPSVKPASLEWAFRATVVWAAFTVLTAAVLWFDKPYLRDALRTANAKRAAGQRRDYSGANSVLEQDVRTAVVGQIVTALITGIILVLIALFMRRGRGWARWLLIAFATVFSVVFPVGILNQLISAVIGSGPALYRIAMGIAGLASVAVVVLLFMPDTRRYFAANRPIATGAAPGGMFGALMGRRPRPADDPAPPVISTRASADDVDGISPRPASRPRTTTRPGSVKAKSQSSGGRSKSRQR